MSPFQPRREPEPRTLAERLGRLNDTLAGLGGQVRSRIAGTVGEAVGDAVRAAVRSLLGERESHAAGKCPAQRDDCGPWASPFGADEDEDDYPDAPPARYRGAAPKASGPSRWRGALAAAAQSALWWLRRQRSRRPVATTSLVALAAGLTALAAGPALAACAGVVASAACLLVTADSAASLADMLSSLLG
jgi:hypothetical protein